MKVRTAEPTSGTEEGEAEVFADLDGKDKEILVARGGEVLKALEHLAFRALGLEPAFHEKIHLDCGGFRALRFEELRMTARVAAERVLASKQPFQLNAMSSRERRIVHLALKDMPGVRTESVGTGEERHVVIHPARSTEYAGQLAANPALGDALAVGGKAHAIGERGWPVAANLRESVYQKTPRWRRRLLCETA